MLHKTIQNSLEKMVIKVTKYTNGKRGVKKR